MKYKYYYLGALLLLLAGAINIIACGLTPALVSIETPPADTSPAVSTVPTCPDAATTAPVRLRAEPSAESSILDNIPAGAAVEVLDCQGDWWRVEYRLLTGYVRARYLR